MNQTQSFYASFKNLKSWARERPLSKGTRYQGWGFELCPRDPHGRWEHTHASCHHHPVHLCLPSKEVSKKCASHDSTYLQFQYLGGWGRLPLSLRPVQSTLERVPGQPELHVQPCLQSYGIPCLLLPSSNTSHTSVQRHLHTQTFRNRSFPLWIVCHHHGGKGVLIFGESSMQVSKTNKSKPLPLYSLPPCEPSLQSPKAWRIPGFAHRHLAQVSKDSELTLNRNCIWNLLTFRARMPLQHIPLTALGSEECIAPEAFAFMINQS